MLFTQRADDVFVYKYIYHKIDHCRFKTRNANGNQNAKTTESHSCFASACPSRAWHVFCVHISSSEPALEEGRSDESSPSVRQHAHSTYTHTLNTALRDNPCKLELFAEATAALSVQPRARTSCGATTADSHARMCVLALRGRSGFVRGRSGFVRGRSGFVRGRSGFVRGRSGFARRRR
jgi:hypothetical protein